MRVALLVFGALFLTSCAAREPRSERPAPQSAMPSPEEMARLSTPSEHHHKLAPLIGTWKHTVHWWMDPHGAPQVMKGTNVNRWILGKRFVMQEVKSADKKRPFEGIGLTGYDNVRERYTGVWMDTMGTGMMSATGIYSPTENAIKEHGTFSCPISGDKTQEFRADWKIIDDDHYRYEMFINDTHGKEFKMMHIDYERVEKS